MFNPCRWCAYSGKCDIEKEKSRQVWLAWTHGGLVECDLRRETMYRGIEGVRA
jgi:hypothetical protein